MSNYEELFTGTMNEITDTGESVDLFQGILCYMKQEGLTEITIKDDDDMWDQKFRVSCDDENHAMKIEIVEEES